MSFATERDAALTGAEATTDTLGRATVGSWTLGDDGRRVLDRGERRRGPD